MTREEAIARIELTATELVGTMAQTEEPSAVEVLQRYVDAYDMAIAALREQDHKRYTTHDVACILAEFTGDDCACNSNGIDEWLPEKCELMDSCPNTVGVACWEQYLKYREDNA